MAHALCGFEGVLLGLFLHVCEGVRVFCLCDACVCVFFWLCVFCLPSLRLVCAWVPLFGCSSVSVFVVFSCAVSCVLMDFRLPS